MNVAVLLPVMRRATLVLICVCACSRSSPKDLIHDNVMCDAQLHKGHARTFIKRSIPDNAPILRLTNVSADRSSSVVVILLYYDGTYQKRVLRYGDTIVSNEQLQTSALMRVIGLETVADSGRIRAVLYRS